MGYRMAVDVGGTFTDMLLFDEGLHKLTLAKVPSTPADPSTGVLAGIEKVCRLAGVEPTEISSILHGTTVATNAVLEGKGARVGLITNKGFEQILHVARGQTPGPLAGWIIMVKPDPLAPLELTRGIAARMSARGEEMVSLDRVEVENCIRELLNSGIEALTVSLINAYANPAHEQVVKQIANEVAPSLPVTISTEILPEFREYERTLTTVMNSYLRPKMRVYLSGMRERLDGASVPSRMDIVRSDGGVMSLDAASQRPVNTLLSGPSGGAVAAAYIGQIAGFPNILSFDMGGTSTDVALSRDGKPNIIRDTHVGTYPVKVPSVDVRSVGAGGGSIAHVPMTGALRVGPQSAGAEPGPACYGKNGTEPTVTDANLLLGYLPPELLGGEMKLDPGAAARAVQKIADAMHLPLLAAAEGIYDIVNESMFGALRLVSLRRGYDPRDFALVALGGAGPLHANALSKLIGSWPTIIPPTPGVLSAFGFLHSDIKTEFSQTIIRTLDRVDGREVRSSLEQLGRHAKQWLDGEHIPPSKQRIEYQADMRYYQQGYEFSIRVEPHWFDNGVGVRRITEDFKQVHYQHYSFNIDHEIELVNLRAIAIGVVPKLKVHRHQSERSSAARPTGMTQIYYRGRRLKASLYKRADLACGARLMGPAVITQDDSTTLILPDCYGVVDPYLNILIRPSGYVRTTSRNRLLKNTRVSRNKRKSEA